MELTAKGRYAVRVMTDLARHTDEFVSLADVSKRQGISVKYLEKVIAMLSRAKLVFSMRGKAGGYKLNSEPEEISVKQILDAVGDVVKLGTCEFKTCTKANACETNGVWFTLTKIINNYLSKVTLKDLIDKTFAEKM